MNDTYVPSPRIPASLLTLITLQTQPLETTYSTAAALKETDETEKRNSWIIAGVVTLLALVMRFWKIEHPAQVVYVLPEHILLPIAVLTMFFPALLGVSVHIRHGNLASFRIFWPRFAHP